jgi:DNA repair exonuclease SbcCD ATPase subunit
VERQALHRNLSLGAHLYFQNKIYHHIKHLSSCAHEEKAMKIYIQNFRFYANGAYEFVFKPCDLTLLSGVNGVGKSTILVAVAWVLFGGLRGHALKPLANAEYSSRPCSETAANEIAMFGLGKNGTAGIVVFDEMNPIIKIRRKAVATAPIDVLIGDDTRLVGDAASAWISQKFGTRNTWTSSAYISQGGQNPLLTLTNAEKFSLLHELTFGYSNNDTSSSSEIGKIDVQQELSPAPFASAVATAVSIARNKAAKATATVAVAKDIYDEAVKRYASAASKIPKEYEEAKCEVIDERIRAATSEAEAITDRITTISMQNAIANEAQRIIADEMETVNRVSAKLEPFAPLDEMKKKVSDMERAFEKAKNELERKSDLKQRISDLDMEIEQLCEASECIEETERDYRYACAITDNVIPKQFLPNVFKFRNFFTHYMKTINLALFAFGECGATNKDQIILAVSEICKQRGDGALPSTALNGLLMDLVFRVWDCSPNGTSEVSEESVEFASGNLEALAILHHSSSVRIHCGKCGELVDFKDKINTEKQTYQNGLSSLFSSHCRIRIRRTQEMTNAAMRTWAVCMDLIHDISKGSIRGIKAVAVAVKALSALSSSSQEANCDNIKKEWNWHIVEGVRNGCDERLIHWVNGERSAQYLTFSDFESAARKARTAASTLIEKRAMRTMLLQDMNALRHDDEIFHNLDEEKLQKELGVLHAIDRWTSELNIAKRAIANAKKRLGTTTQQQRHIAPSLSSIDVETSQTRVKNLKEEVKLLQNVSIALHAVNEISAAKNRVENAIAMEKEAAREAANGALALRAIGAAASSAIQSTIETVCKLTNVVLIDLFPNSETPIHIDMKLVSKAGNVTTTAAAGSTLTLSIFHRGVEFDGPSLLSGGELHRLSMALTIAMCCASASPIAMFDESLSSLDSDLRDSSVAAIRKYLCKKTVIAVLHEAVRGHFDTELRV